MCKLFLTEPHTIIKNGQEVHLHELVYNISDENLMKENGFLKCHKCKNYFDKIEFFTKYHPKFNEKEYCSGCIQ